MFLDLQLESYITDLTVCQFSWLYIEQLYFRKQKQKGLVFFLKHGVYKTE